MMPSLLPSSCLRDEIESFCKTRLKSTFGENLRASFDMSLGAGRALEQLQQRWATIRGGRSVRLHIVGRAIRRVERLVARDRLLEMYDPTIVDAFGRLENEMSISVHASSIRERVEEELQQALRLRKILIPGGRRMAQDRASAGTRARMVVNGLRRERNSLVHIMRYAAMWLRDLLMSPSWISARSVGLEGSATITPYLERLMPLSASSGGQSMRSRLTREPGDNTGDESRSRLYEAIGDRRLVDQFLEALVKTYRWPQTEMTIVGLGAELGYRSEPVPTWMYRALAVLQDAPYNCVRLIIGSPSSSDGPDRIRIGAMFGWLFCVERTPRARLNEVYREIGRIRQACLKGDPHEGEDLESKLEQLAGKARELEEDEATELCEIVYAPERLAAVNELRRSLETLTEVVTKYGTPAADHSTAE